MSERVNYLKNSFVISYSKSVTKIVESNLMFHRTRILHEVQIDLMKGV
jgi:hypothetical protein